MNAEYPPIEIFLNAKNALNSNPNYYSDCSYQLPKCIVAPDGYSLYVQVLSFTCPVSWHVINSYCNTLSINSTVYTLVPGNYSVRTLTSALTALLPGITASFSETTLKMTLSCATSFVIGGTLCDVLGIAAGSSGTTLSSKHTVDLTGSNSIFLLSNFSTSNNNIDTRPGSASVLCRVPVNVAPMQVLQYEDFNGRAGLLLDSDTIANIQLELEDENRQPLQATIAWEMTLQVTFVYTGRTHMLREVPLGLRAPLR